ncbi:unnamed protein product [Adineta ricciae]|uniref:Uncharacterized protein n=1 Tax=Adineta ricciae TaxID=249248 RepID=A0A815RME9_ADIRI|nr:unnamed protein product [Adineta ricciae]CAF1627025.1 unnamed protein product [Adineta ricciae]
MLPFFFVTIVLLSVKIDGRILLYNTENDEIVEKFDCVYYVSTFGEEILYCRRPSTVQSLDRQRDDCDNQGEKVLFRDLLYRGIDPSIVLEWNSSIEVVDLYAEVFYNRSLFNNDDNRSICICRNGKFGKYCEYQLTHDKNLFSETIDAQFEGKRDTWNVQRYGAILCYQTLPCPSSPLCLDWREICDGKQRCPNGIDEENCDKLAFNECEDDAFRCTNGMCIAEVIMIVWIGDWCWLKPDAINCDEHLCLHPLY